MKIAWRRDCEQCREYLKLHRAGLSEASVLRICDTVRIMPNETTWKHKTKLGKHIHKLATKGE